ncbi:MAG: inverse autotransporter beta domain-containing protein [Fuerstiella sp.]|nr:inverse autotransporter beta domain-containing protein [Fuerstiella sp.]
MTSVQNLRRKLQLSGSQDASHDIVTNSNFSPLRLAGLSLRVCMLTIATTVFTAVSATAQDGEFSFGRTPIGRTPSGVAGGVVDVNRQGIGIQFRGGHVAGNTVGRTESVSNVGLSPYLNVGDGMIFGDTRLTFSNDGGVAYSFGTGYRHYIAAIDAVLGGNVYYDQDEIAGARFKQYGFGAELLAHDWEVRGNVYNLFGTTSELTGTRVAPGSALFAGNNLEFSRIDTFAEAIDGFDAEIGNLLPGEFAERVDLRAFAGGYFYEGQGLDGFGGFSTRLQADIGDWLELGLQLTDDDVFHTNVAFSATVHFGGFESQEHTSRSGMQRMAEPVRRNLNIPAAIADVTIPGQIANALDGTPLTVVHVNSNDAIGPFIGTVEDPLQSLSAGLGVPGADLVFVHGGSLFAAAPDNQVVLADDQNLFGEGLVTEANGGRNVINIVALENLPAFVLPDSPTFQANPTFIRPTISNSVGPAVTLGNRSRLGGFILDGSAGHGILADTVSDVAVRDTLISNAAGTGILLQNTLDSVTITNTAIEGSGGPAFHVSGGNADIGYVATSTGVDPAFGRIINSSAAAVLVENTTGGTINMTGSTIDDTGGTGIVIQNSAGNATIDNALIVDSTATGISVLNSSGTYFFRDTIRDATTITNATGASVLIDGLQSTGRVNFENLDIISPQGGGIDIDNLEGVFSFARDLTIGQAAAGSVAPFISVSNSLATGVVNFGGDITIFATPTAPATFSGGRGIELVSNAAGSSFTATGQTNITSVGAEGIAIVNDSSDVIFGTATSGGASIVEPLLQGLSIQNTDGVLGFRTNTNILKSTNPGVPLVDIQDSQAAVQFDLLQVNTTTGDIGVNLVNNVAGANGPGTVTVDTLGILSTDGVGLFADTNTFIRTNTGTIDVTNEAALEILNSGIDIDLEMVTSINSPRFGLHLMDTNKDLNNHTRVAKTFTVRGDSTLTTASPGGQILAAATEGALLENAGQVSLRGMEFRDNQTGIRVVNTLDIGGTLNVLDDQFLQLFGINMFDSDFVGVVTTNLTELDIRDSLFDNNGDVANVDNETLLLLYTERPNDDTTTRFSEFDNPYTINIERTQFSDNTDDVIRIANSVTAIGAHIGVNVESNLFTVNDAFEFSPGVNPNEFAFGITWNGPARVNLEDNAFELVFANPAIATGFQIAMFTDMNSSTDLLQEAIVGNRILNSDHPGAVGIRTFTSGPSEQLIDSNDMIFGGVNSNGMEFNLGSDTVMDIVNNRMRFEGDSGRGIFVDRLIEPASFQISNNLIQLSDIVDAFGRPNATLEEGIFFRSASGAYNIFGAQNNVIEMISFGNIQRVVQFNGNVNGQILVNGALVP